MDSTQTDKKILDDLPLFDRVMFSILKVSPLPVQKKESTQVGIATVLRLYWQSLREHRFAVPLCVITAAFASAMGVLIPYIFKQFLGLLGPGQEASQVEALHHIILIFVAVSLLAWVSWRTSYLATAYLAARMLAKLRQRAFAYLLEHSHQFFINTFAGSLVQKVNRFAQSYDRLADRVLFDIIPIIVQVVFILYILSLERPILAVVILIWATIFVLWNYIFAKWKLKYDTSRAAQDSFSSARLADSVSNHQTIELYKSQKVEEKLYQEVTDLQSEYARFSWQSSNIVDAVQALMIIAVQAAVLYIGVDLWSQGLMTIGLFVLVQTYVLLLAERLWSLSRVVRDVYESFADAQEMADIMVAPHGIQEKRRAKSLEVKDGEIRFSDVVFSFHGRNVVDHLSLSIKKGQKIALVGVSGAGKSTLIKLLFRQYDPDGGQVEIDGQNIKDVTLASLRGALSLVPQDPALFHRTLMENIRYGKQGSTLEEAKHAAKLAHCDDFISGLPLGYDTLVGERGVKLSGGERQRVAIARAFLRNSPILVLDEATSSLDSHSEERIQDSLMKLMEGKTTIIIAHRLSTIRRVDRILVMKDGRVVEDGSHDELLTKEDGVYANLWNIQQGGFLKDEGEQDTEEQNRETT